jgi:hypothetical protein
MEDFVRFPCQGSFWGSDTFLGDWYTAQAVEIQAEEFELELGELSKQELELPLANILAEKSCPSLVVTEKIAAGHPLDNIHQDERAEPKDVVGCASPRAHDWHWDGSSLSKELQHPDFRHDLFVSVLGVNKVAKGQP